MALCKLADGRSTVPRDPGPMVRRRQLGLALRSFRVRAGMSVTEAAAVLYAAPSKISRIENGQRTATLRDVRDLSEAYQVPGDIRERLMDLAKESRQRAWWQDANLDPALETLIGMEGAAKHISEFEPLLIPGLLQTTEYARAVLDVYRGENTSKSQTIFDSRMRRQQILQDSSPPRLSIVLDEAALRREVGGKAVMREQLAYLDGDFVRSVAEIRIIPFSAGVHVGTLNGFIILDFDDPIPHLPAASIPGVVYVETLAVGTYYDQAADVDLHRRAFTELSRNADSPAKSGERLKAILHEM